MMKKKPPVLSKKAKELIDEFGNSAGQQTWQQDQGSDIEEIANSQKNYTADLLELQAYVLSLEVKAAKLKVRK